MRNNIKVLHISDTWYIFKRRGRSEIACNLSPQLDDFLGKLKDILDTTKKLSDKQLRDTEERNKREEAKKLDELMNVPSIKSAYKDLEITNKKLIETADKLSNLDTFLNNTMELTNLKKEYSTIARECLIQLTKFRISVQTWASEHPEYARVADAVLTGVKAGAIVIAGAGIVIAFAGTAPISVPVAVLGTGIAVSKELLKECIRQEIVKYATKQGKNLREKLEFEETANWIIDGVTGIKNTKTMCSTNNWKTILKPHVTKTYIPKIDKNIEIAHILRDAGKEYYKTHKQRLMNDVLNIFVNG